MIKNIATSTMFMIMLLSAQPFSASDGNTQQDAKSFALLSCLFRLVLLNALGSSDSAQEIERLCRENPNARAMINLNQDSKEGEPFIHSVAMVGDTEEMEALLSAGANTRALDMNGGTPVHTLCAWNGVQTACKGRAALRVLHAAGGDDSIV